MSEAEAAALGAERLPADGGVPALKASSASARLSKDLNRAAGNPCTWRWVVAQSVKRASGFLSPSFGNSHNLGMHLTLPYYFVLGPDKDFTLTPRITTLAGPVVAGVVAAPETGLHSCPVGLAFAEQEVVDCEGNGVCPVAEQRVVLKECGPQHVTHAVSIVIVREVIRLVKCSVGEE